MLQGPKGVQGPQTSAIVRTDSMCHAQAREAGQCLWDVFTIKKLSPTGRELEGFRGVGGVDAEHLVTALCHRQVDVGGEGVGQGTIHVGGVGRGTRP